MIDPEKLFLERYGAFTGIQKLAMGQIKEGRNCLVIAPTGSGKTEAAMLPLLQSVQEKGFAPGIRIIYITPLRALNRDMVKRLEWLCNGVGATVSVRHGDTTQTERRKQAKLAPSVLITTPETLQSILPTRSIGPYLKNVLAVVVDEVHELYHSKRGTQLSVALERLEHLAPGFQRVGISATVSDPPEVAAFLSGGRECRIAEADNVKEVQLTIEMPNEHKKNSEMMDRFGLDQPALARLERIALHIRESASTIVFANTRQVVEALGSRLLYLNGLEPFGGIGLHHGSLDREERIRIEDEFKAGKIKGIIATSSLELGIDVGKVDLVVQYGSPRQAIRLLQRIGRSGHTEKRIARGAIITIGVMDAVETLALATNANNKTLETFPIRSDALDVLANQICGIALDREACEVKDLEKTVRAAYAYRDFSAERLAVLLAFMARQRMIGFDGKRITSGPRTRMYYYGHLSVIPDSKHYLVKSIADNRIISRLDEGFVVRSVEEGSVFITKGLPWKVVSIDESIISVEPSSDLEAAVPDWSGEDIPVSHGVAKAVFRILDKYAKGEHYEVPGCKFTDGLSTAVENFALEQKRFSLPSSSSLLVEKGDEYAILHTGLGTMANEALSRLIAYRMSELTGSNVGIKSSPYLIFLEIKGKNRMEDVLLDIAMSARKDLDRALREAVADTDLFRYKFVTVAKLFGIIDRDSSISKSIAKRIIRVMLETPVYEETMRELMHDYFDTQTLDKFLASLSRDNIRTISPGTLSPIAKMVLDSAYYTRELIMPLLPSDQVVDSFAEFMQSKSMKMLCTYCGFMFSRKIVEIKDVGEILCANCNSPMIAPYKDEYAAVVKKRKDEKALTKAEAKLFKEMMALASLFSSYGGKAVVALSTYGVGQRSAARILMMFRKQDRLFYMDLIDAQKQFIRTKKYWSADR